jgi:hypothetical protein
MRRGLAGSVEPATASRVDIATLLFFVAGLVGVLQAHYQPVAWSRGFEMISIAQNLADHGAFANPFYALSTGPTAVNPPLYPLLLALLMKLLKQPGLVVLAATLGSLLANAITAALLPYVSFLFFGEVISGSAASVLWIGAMEVLPAWDTSYTVAGLLAIVLLTASDAKKSTHMVRRGALAGIVAGSLFLLNPSCVLLFVPWLLYLSIRARTHAPHTLKYFFVVLIAFCILPVVWSTRNYHQLGAFVIRTNLGMTLYASNNDCAQSTLIEDELNRCYQTHHPNVSVNEAQLLRNLGEVQYDRNRTVETKNWIYLHPHRFAGLTLARIGEFWFPPVDTNSRYHAYFISLITALSIPGLILMGRRREPLTPFVLTVLLLYPLMYYIVVTDTRYRYPILWLSLLPAGYCVRQLLALVVAVPAYGATKIQPDTVAEPHQTISDTCPVSTGQSCRLAVQEPPAVKSAPQ